MINRTKHQLKRSSSRDYCDLHILEHPSEDKQTEIGEIRLKGEVKTEESDDPLSVDGDMKVKYEEDDNVNDFVWDPLKYESVSFQCTLCLEEFIHENAYVQHVCVHLQNGEGDGGCDTSQVCKPHTAVSSSSSHSSLITENKQADPSPSAHASIQNEVPKAEYIVPVTNITLQGKTYCYNNVSNIQYYNNSSQNSLHTEKIPLMCDICQKMFRRKSHLVKHIKAHSIIKLFPCTLCDYKCNQKGNLVSHMRTHTGEKPYACHLCEYKCAHKCSLKTHMRTHTGEKSYTCKICNTKFSHNCTLVVHMRTHTGEKPFACELCEYKCAKRGNLVHHMRRHTDEKPYSFTICEYKCSDKGNLIIYRPIRTHTKPYICSVCNKKFARNHHLAMHMKTHTNCDI